jgi:hypothetical protein
MPQRMLAPSSTTPLSASSSGRRQGSSRQLWWLQTVSTGRSERAACARRKWCTLRTSVVFSTCVMNAQPAEPAAMTASLARA